MRYVCVSETDLDLLDESAALLTRMYGEGSHYSRWVVNGFRPFSRDYLLGQVRNPLRDLWVLLHERKVVAMIIIQVNGKGRSKHALFHKFVADPAFKGVGARLLAFAERKVRDLGIPKARVEVFSPAIKLMNYYIKKKYDKAIEYKQLMPDEHVRFVCDMEHGFVTLEKTWHL